MDLSLLPEEKKDVWLKFLSNTVMHFHRELMALQGQLNEYRDTAMVALSDKERADFVASVSPSIKTGMFGVFLRVIFPSKVEVTTSKDRRALTSFGLTEQCGFATLVFRLIFKSQGTASKPCNVGADSSSYALHPFDTPEMHEQLWFASGVGSYSLKQLNKTRNTYTCMIREVSSKCWSINLSCISCYLTTTVHCVSL